VAAHEVESLEQRWGVTLPEEYKQLVSVHQGMSPEPSVFDVGLGQNSVGVLLTISEAPGREEYSARSTYEALGKHMPRGIYPFAMTPSGDYVCFDYRASSRPPSIVFFSGQSGEEPILALASSFSEFLAKLHG
jgi:cell wall assembly regulator SMI1